MPVRRNPTAGDYALGAIGAAAALLLAVLVFAIPRMAGEGEHSATSSNEPTVEEEDPFTIELLADGRGILLAGRLSHGMTEQLESLLGGGAPIIHIELNSPGGLVAEARGLVRLIDAYNLSTFVAEDCLSACTLAFASGSTRHLAPGARLGFHRYRLASPLMPLFMDAAQEQRKDREILRRRGVPQAFIERIDATPPEAMWFPSHAELIAAHMVDRIGPPD